ncbi:O-antigen ligase family protein [Aliiglaciecola aliphaticivorans]
MSTDTSVTWKTLHPVGKFFISIFLIVLFEGAIRKWVWGSATIPLLGLRDLIVAIAVFWGFLHRYYDARAIGESILLFWTVLIVVWTTIQMLSGLQPLIVGGIGFRFWVLYLWFALLCARALNWQDIEYLFKIFALTLLFMVPLALAQFMSPPSAFINRQAGGDDQLIFTVVKDIVRTTGTFSFTVGFTTYLAFVTPAVLWLMAGGLKDQLNSLLRLLIIGLFFVGVLISGSRGAIMTTLFFIGMWLLALIFANKIPKISPSKMLFGLAGLIVLFFLLFPVIERSYEANAQRFDNAAASEDVGGRIKGMYMGADETWEQFALLGYGIGAGANASRGFMPATNDGFLLGENEVDRVLNEGGVVGMMLVLFKWLLIIIGLLSAWNIFKRYNEFLPLSIWLVIAIQLPTGSIIGQLTVHGFSLLLLGLGFVALACWQTEKNRRRGLTR